MGTVRRGRPDELTPFTGQTAGLIGELPAGAGEIARAMIAGAERGACGRRRH